MGKREFVERHGPRHFTRIALPTPVLDVESDDEIEDNAELREIGMGALRDVLTTLTRPRTSTTPAPRPPAPRRAAARPAITPKPRRGEMLEPQDGRELSPKPPSLPFTRDIPAGAQPCRYCDRAATFVVIGGGFGKGVLMCRDHADSEYRAPELRVWAVTSW